MHEVMEDIKWAVIVSAFAAVFTAIIGITALWFVAQIGLMKIGLAELGIVLPFL